HHEVSDAEFYCALSGRRVQLEFTLDVRQGVGRAPHHDQNVGIGVVSVPVIGQQSLVLLDFSKRPSRIAGAIGIGEQVMRSRVGGKTLKEVLDKSRTYLNRLASARGKNVFPDDLRVGRHKVRNRTEDR